jgi:hypothetical protein
MSPPKRCSAAAPRATGVDIAALLGCRSKRRHFDDVLAGSLELAAAEDPNEISG